MTENKTSCVFEIPKGAVGYERLFIKLHKLDLKSVFVNEKIDVIEREFWVMVSNDEELSDALEYINGKALDDRETVIKFAYVLSTDNFDNLVLRNGTKVRSGMIKTLENNFLSVNDFEKCDKQRLYNSIVLLGNYYQRIRLIDNKPIAILGVSLLDLLTRQVSYTLFDMKPCVAKLLLTQMALNGELLYENHQTEMCKFLIKIRRFLVEQSYLNLVVKASLLYIIELSHVGFKLSYIQLKEIYGKYLIEADYRSSDKASIISSDMTFFETLQDAQPNKDRILGVGTGTFTLHSDIQSEKICLSSTQHIDSTPLKNCENIRFGFDESDELKPLRRWRLLRFKQEFEKPSEQQQSKMDHRKSFSDGSQRFLTGIQNNNANRSRDNNHGKSVDRHYNNHKTYEKSLRFLKQKTFNNRAKYSSKRERSEQL